MPRIEPLPAPPGANPLQFSALTELKESVRRATASRVGCRFCATLGELEPEFDDAREALAVDLALAIAEDPRGVSDEQFAALRAEFSEDEIVELVCWICLVTVAGQMFGAVMDVRPATPDEAAAYQEALEAKAAARA